MAVCGSFQEQELSQKYPTDLGPLSVAAEKFLVLVRHGSRFVPQ